MANSSAYHGDLPNGNVDESHVARNGYNLGSKSLRVHRVPSSTIGLKRQPKVSGYRCKHCGVKLLNHFPISTHYITSPECYEAEYGIPYEKQETEFDG